MGTGNSPVNTATVSMISGEIINYLSNMLFFINLFSNHSGRIDLLSFLTSF